MHDGNEGQRDRMTAGAPMGFGAEPSVPSVGPPGLGGGQSEIDARLEAEDASGDLSNPQVFGRLFEDSVYKILKVGSIYNIDHNQTRIAVDEFMGFFQQAMRQIQDDSVSLVIQDELAVVNGETLRLHRRAQARHNELRDLFAAADIRGLAMSRGMRAEDFLQFLGSLAAAAKVPEQTLEGLHVPNIEIEHGPPVRNILKALAKVNKAMYVAHIYIRGLVKTRNMHDQVRERLDPDIPTGVIRRLLQTISKLLGDDDFTVLGLLPLRLVPPDLSSHSFNTAIYAMLMADRMGLTPQMVSYVGMAVIYQDIDRLVGINVAQRDKLSALDPERQFRANLRDVAKMLNRIDGDVVSTLRALLTYERGCPYDRSVERPFYRAPRHLHLVTRIVDLCRIYDLMIQGLEGYKARRPDLAIQYIESRAGEVFDPHLVTLFVSTMGVYPIGTLVELTSGERAIVIRTPDPSGDPRRPVVRLMSHGNQVVVDLADPRYANIEIARSLPPDESQDFQASQVFLLT